MTLILAIDPGPEESAWVVLDAKTCEPINFAKELNKVALDRLRSWDVLPVSVIEMVASYGMAVGAEVFETAVWIGRFQEAIDSRRGRVERITRRPVKLHHCGNAAAKDGNIAQALVDRFAPGTRNHGKGIKAAPGFFYGFRADIWQAYALGVYAADTLTDTEGELL